MLELGDISEAEQICSHMRRSYANFGEQGGSPREDRISKSSIYFVPVSVGVLHPVLESLDFVYNTRNW